MTTVLYIHYFDGVPRYVGIGTHQRPYNFSSRNGPWRQIRERHGLPDVVVLGEYDTRDAACLAEVHLIAALRQMGFDLANLTTGGDSGGSLSDATRRKMSDAHLNRVRSDEERRAASERSRATWRNPELRQKMLNAIRASMANTRRRAECSERSRASMADPTRRLQIADKLREHWADPTRRLQESERKKVLMQTDARRKACSDAARQMHADPAFRARYLAGRATPVQCIETGETFPTVKAAADAMGEPMGRLRAHLLKGRPDFAGSTWVYVPKI